MNLTKEQIIEQCKAFPREQDYAKGHKIFDDNFSVNALDALEGKDLAVGLFSAKENGRIGYFAWAEFGELGKAAIGSTHNIQYNDTKQFFRTWEKESRTILESVAIICAEEVRNIFKVIYALAENYVTAKRLENIDGYRKFSEELLALLKKQKLNTENESGLFYNRGGATAYILKYLHCSFPDCFSFWYNYEDLKYFLTEVLQQTVDNGDNRLVLSGQLALQTKELGLDSDHFGVWLNYIKQSEGGKGMKYISIDLRDKFLKWAESKGYSYKDYCNYLDALIKKAVGNKLITESEVNVEDVVWLDKLRALYDSNASLKVNDTSGNWSAALNAFKLFIESRAAAIPPETPAAYESPLVGHELNLILYGPPGTGKTYDVVRHAVAIIEKKKVEEVKKDDYADVFKRYKQYIKDERVKFITFHQSYGYEEFIEGIKPDCEDGGLKYKIEDGVFKEFCNNARQLKTGIAGKYGVSASSTVWKVSLGGAAGANIKDDCFKNNRIRLGWGSSYTPEKAETEEYEGDGKRIVDAFIGAMKKGDIVFSFLSATKIDAIGVITEDEAKYDGDWDEYNWYRNVKWIKKNKEIDIIKLNDNKRMVQPAVYKLSVTVDDALKLLEEAKPDGADYYDYSEPYVFIIDEINRGNISKIFGELITLIEPSKRLNAKEETTCVLPYSKKEFGVPENVYILGTMNTADRSLVQLDAALRRRFAFKEVMPAPGLLTPTSDGIDLAKLLETINDRITVLLDREHQIGHSYLLGVKNVKELAYKFRQKIIPLLQEYFFDDYTLIEEVLSGAFVEERTVNLRGEEKTVYELKIPVNPQDYIDIYSGKSEAEE